MRRPGSDGSHWDTAKLRRAREFGWFKQHEAELIQAARDRQSAGSPAHGIPDRCPACGHEMIRRDEVEGIPVAECRVCDWIAVDHDQLDKLLARSSRDDRH
jgi:TFIIB-like protein